MRICLHWSDRVVLVVPGVVVDVLVDVDGLVVVGRMVVGVLVDVDVVVEVEVVDEVVDVEVLDELVVDVLTTGCQLGSLSMGGTAVGRRVTPLPSGLATKMSGPFGAPKALEEKTILVPSGDHAGRTELARIW
ncbi:MAG: hypothetical protein ABR540_20970, partial [Acidimicrobiales bacterium]